MPFSLDFWVFLGLPHDPNGVVHVNAVSNQNASLFHGHHISISCDFLTVSVDPFSYRVFYGDQVS